ncbi:MAG: hypothetical protein R3D28_12570 [Geminicoccaceae bacterium]
MTTLLSNFIVLLFVGMMLEGPLGPDEPRLAAERAHPGRGEPAEAGGADPPPFRPRAGAGRGHPDIQRTRFGFELRAVGANPDAARFAGIAERRVMLKVALFSGAMAGLAGVGEVAGLKGYLTQDLSPGYGYAGIVVATLAQLGPVSVVASAIFIAGVFVGADEPGHRCFELHRQPDRRHGPLDHAACSPGSSPATGSADEQGPRLSTGENLGAAGLVCLVTALFAVSDTVMKHLFQTVPVGQVMGLRGILICLLLLAVLVLRRRRFVWAHAASPVSLARAVLRRSPSPLLLHEPALVAARRCHGAAVRGADHHDGHGDALPRRAGGCPPLVRGARQVSRRAPGRWPDQPHAGRRGLSSRCSPRPSSRSATSSPATHCRSSTVDRSGPHHGDRRVAGWLPQPAARVDQLIAPWVWPGLADLVKIAVGAV